MERLRSKSATAKDRGGGGVVSPRTGSGTSFRLARRDGEQPQSITELANAARENLQYFFARPSASASATDADQAAVTSNLREAASAALSGDLSADALSPSESLSEALQLDEESSSLTFAHSMGMGTPPPPQRQASTVAAGAASSSTERQDADSPASLYAEQAAVPSGGSGAQVAEAEAASPRSLNTAAEVERSGASAAVDSLRLLLSDHERLSKALAARREAVRERTSAGLAAVDSLGPGATLLLVAVAAAALAWSHGRACLSVTLWLLGSHGAEVVAAFCLAVVALKAALAAHIDTRLRNFLDGMDEMHASVKLVQVMQEDVHTMRVIIERMQEDLDAKTAWIPKGIKPPAWLPGQKTPAQ